MQFTLGAKSTAVFTGYWEGVVVPTPGALATLAVAGGLANRRRRTS
jgi:MYXO-CTERM domain-containing protein